jgi:Rab-GTPase-TBC domain
MESNSSSLSDQKSVVSSMSTLDLVGDDDTDTVNHHHHHHHQNEPSQQRQSPTTPKSRAAKRVAALVSGDSTRDLHHLFDPESPAHGQNSRIETPTGATGMTPHSRRTQSMMIPARTATSSLVPPQSPSAQSSTSDGARSMPSSPGDRRHTIAAISVRSSKNSGKFATLRRPSSNRSKLSKRERLLHQLTNTWHTDILPNFSTKVRNSRKVLQLCWEGIPSSVRPDAWRAIIGNDLHITKDLFEIMVVRGRRECEIQRVKRKKEMDRLRKEQEDFLAARAAATDSTDNGTNSGDERSDSDHDSNDDAEPDSPGLMHDASGALFGVEEKAELRSKENSMQLIATDIPRTFPHLKIFHNDGPLYQPLVDVLQAFVVYRPDIGYVQGMSYLASMFLLNMDAMSSFIALANLLNQDLYFSFFRMDQHQMSGHIKLYEEFFQSKLPTLFEHFRDIDLTPDMYMYEWMLTIFSRSMKLETAHRVWDNYLLNGPVFLFRTALGILRMHRSQFLHMPFEHAMTLLGKVLPTIDEEELFSNIASISINREEFEKLAAQHLPKSTNALSL